MVPKPNTVAAVMAELDMSHRESPHNSAVQQQRLGSLTGRTRLGEDEYGLLSLLPSHLGFVTLVCSQTLEALL